MRDEADIIVIPLGVLAVAIVAMLAVLMWAVLYAVGAWAAVR